MKRNSIKKITTFGMVALLCFSVAVPKITAEAKAEKSKLVVIDPGCQTVDSKDKESVGPGAWNRVVDDMVGAKGVKTENAEYDINLQVALKTQKELEDMGYKVKLTRTKNDVDMNNLERAMIANTLSADLYISIHASDENKKTSGVGITCETKDNPYNFEEYRHCRLLADTLLGSLEESTGNAKEDVIESDEIIGINWCDVPNAIVRVGNLRNEEDDELLATEEYQQKLAGAIAAGVESYFAQR